MITELTPQQLERRAELQQFGSASAGGLLLIHALRGT